MSLSKQAKKRFNKDGETSGSHIKKLKQEIDSITECAICQETLKDARMLLCCHCFCLECLKSCCRGKSVGDSISCPYCRKPFTIPSGGLEKLTVCHFITKLIDVNKLTDKNSDQSGDGCCSVCLAIDRKEPAAGYCFECREDLCYPCLQRHKVMNSTKSHQTVDHNEKPDAKELLKTAVSFCEEHPDQIIHFFCFDCQIIACIACNLARHKDHNCLDIKDSSLKVSQILDDQWKQVKQFMVATTEVEKSLTETQTKFEQEVKNIKDVIKNRYQERKRLLHSQYRALRDDLSLRKMEREGALRMLKDEVETELAAMKSFEKYWSELKDCGSACDILQVASSLQNRADELIAQHNQEQARREDTASSDHYQILFMLCGRAMDQAKNSLGRIECIVKTNGAVGPDAGIEEREDTSEEETNPEDQESDADDDDDETDQQDESDTNEQDEGETNEEDEGENSANDSTPEPTHQSVSFEISNSANLSPRSGPITIPQTERQQSVRLTECNPLADLLSTFAGTSRPTDMAPRPISAPRRNWWANNIHSNIQSQTTQHPAVASSGTTMTPQSNNSALPARANLLDTFSGAANPTTGALRNNSATPRRLRPNHWNRYDQYIRQITPQSAATSATTSQSINSALPAIAIADNASPYRIHVTVQSSRAARNNRTRNEGSDSN